MPNFSKITSSKHHLVIDDCNKLAPTNAVNHNQFKFTYNASIKLIKIKLPANALTILCFIFLFFSYIDCSILSTIAFTGFFEVLFELKLSTSFSILAINSSDVNVKNILESKVSL